MDPLTRERLGRGATATLADADLLAVLADFRQSPTLRAQSLLKLLGGLHEAATHTYDELLAVGFSTAQAGRLVCAFELASRLREPQDLCRLQLLQPGDVARLLSPRLASLPQEEAVVVHLDARRRLLGTTTVGLGSTCSVPVQPSEVFRSALRHRACSIVFVHNHPSGDPRPSPEDHELTRRLTDAGAMIGVPLDDHVIVASGGYYSFQEAEGTNVLHPPPHRRAAY